MNKRLTAWLLATLALAGLGAERAVATLPAVVDGEPLPSIAPMLERATPAVVNIATTKAVRVEENPLLNDPFFRRFFDLPERKQRRQSSSLGSGVVVDARQGLVLTNHHVIDKADEIEVTLKDGRKLKAQLVGSDAETDIAVLRIPAERLSAIPLGDSDRLRVGDFVVAIGNPFALGQTVTSGIVSALGRSGLGIEGYENFIQTDASINPGNSGGPLVNLRGQLVGINTAIYAPSGGNVGIGFAIPSAMAKAVMEQIIEYGEIRRGLFGVGVQDLTPDLAQAFDLDHRGGAMVTKVEPRSSAARAGLAVGDVVVRVNGREVVNGADLRNQIGLMRVGSRVDLDVLRDGRALSLSAKLADPYENFIRGKKVADYFTGCLLGDTIDESALGRLEAVAVGPVEPESRAWTMGLREGDVIFEANRQRVRGIEELERVARSRDGIQMLRLRRGNQVLLVLSRG
jgi:Do/DeqQ family serine protease